MYEKPPLRAVDVSKRYAARHTVALKGLDLEIPRGSIAALIGPNGAGKSTLLKAWVGFERPDQGSLWVNGVNPWVHRERALDAIGYVPQVPSLYPQLTVDDHLAFAHSRRRGFDRSTALAHLRRFDIPHLVKAATLSGGQRAQLSLSLALGTRAPILLLDEPLASLDPLARREFLQVLVEDVRDRGATVLMTSHVVGDVAQACDRVIVLGSGRKLLDETVDSAISRHRTIEEAGAVGAIAGFPSPMGEQWSLTTGRSAGRPATLEEIFLGYLSAGRIPNDGGVGRTSVRSIPASPILVGIRTADERIDVRESGPIVLSAGVRVAEVIGALGRGSSLAEVQRLHPGLSKDDILACLRYASGELERMAGVTHTDSDL